MQDIRHGMPSAGWHVHCPCNLAGSFGSHSCIGHCVLMHDSMHRRGQQAISVKNMQLCAHSDTSAV